VQSSLMQEPRNGIANNNNIYFFILIDIID
jgi:hypothetical protein